MASPPKVDAFLVCDHVHQDSTTNKYTVIGTWDKVQAPVFPASCAECGVYLNLTGLNGNYEFALEILGPDLETVVERFDVPGMFVAEDPNARYEFGFNVAGLRFPAPGRYTLRLLYNRRVGAEFTILTRVPPP